MPLISRNLDFDIAGSGSVEFFAVAGADTQAVVVVVEADPGAAFAIGNVEDFAVVFVADFVIELDNSLDRKSVV